MKKIIKIIFLFVLAAKTASAEGQKKHMRFYSGIFFGGGLSAEDCTRSLKSDFILIGLTNFDSWAQCGFTTLIGGGGAFTKQANNWNPKVLFEFFTGPTFNMQFGIFGINAIWNFWHKHLLLIGMHQYV